MASFEKDPQFKLAACTSPSSPLNMESVTWKITSFHPSSPSFPLSNFVPQPKPS